jgi:hypothetical protein
MDQFDGDQRRGALDLFFRGRPAQDRLDLGHHFLRYARSFGDMRLLGKARRAQVQLGIFRLCRPWGLPREGDE